MWPEGTVMAIWWFLFVISPDASLRSSTTRHTTNNLSSTPSKTDRSGIPDEFLDYIVKSPSPPQQLRGNGYCNAAYRIPEVGILKVFSELAKQRMSVSGLAPLASIDRHVGELGLGPRILASSERGILMEELDATSVKEEDIHSEPSAGGDNNNKLLTALADSLASIHSIQLPKLQQAPNMLWSALDVLLSRIEDPVEQDYYRQQVEWQCELLSDVHLPMVCGHGDCKPNNLQWDGTRVQFLDLEMAGHHYRAFDLAKLFRTSTPTRFTSLNQNVFLEAYAGGLREDSNLLRLESNVLLPMTWLEAAIFFEAMGGLSDLALDRKANYQRACQDWREDIDAYKTCCRLRSSSSSLSSCTSAS